MKDAKKVLVNRCFGDNCPQNTDPKREQKIKEVLSDNAQRRRANKEIDYLLTRFRGKRLIQILPAIKRQVIKGDFPKYILDVALERVERKHHELGSEDAIFLAQFKASLEKSE